MWNVRTNTHTHTIVQVNMYVCVCVCVREKICRNIYVYMVI